jgi:hypothetical protein
MELTGHSTDFTADSSFPEAMRRFVTRARERWPRLLVSGEPQGRAAPWRLPEPDGDDDGYSKIVTFSAGPEMEDFWEEHGYALDGSGEGPYAVFYRHHNGPVQATTVSSAVEDGCVAAVGEGLLMAEYYAVSLHTPRDPATDPFSAGVVRELVESFGGGPRHEAEAGGRPGLDLDGIEELCTVATPGPWFVRSLDDDHAMNLVAVSTVEDTGLGERWPDFDHGELVAATLVQEPRYVDCADGRWDENARFIAMAREAVPRLVEEVRRLRRLLAAEGLSGSGEGPAPAATGP